MTRGMGTRKIKNHKEKSCFFRVFGPLRNRAAVMINRTYARVVRAIASSAASKFPVVQEQINKAAAARPGAIARALRGGEAAGSVSFLIHAK